MLLLKDTDGTMKYIQYSVLSTLERITSRKQLNIWKTYISPVMIYYYNSRHFD